MIDKLDFKFRHEINVAELYKYYKKICISSQCLPDTHYGKVTIFKLGEEKTITLKCQPIMFARAPATILSNPARFHNFEEYISTVLPTEETRTGEIQRIDFATDLAIPLSELFLRTTVKYKQKTKEYRESRGRVFQGFSIGTNGHQVIFYDKGLEIKKNGSLKPSRGDYNIGDLSRVEVRIIGKKASEFSLGCINKIISFNPFSKILIVDFLDNPYGEKLERESLAYGFHRAKSLLNETNNFTKQYSRGFRVSPLNKDLLEQHKKDLEVFFTGDNYGKA